MHSPKWTVVAKTSPLDSAAAHEEERWLKLGDDALSNRKAEIQPENERLLTPGARAKSQLRTIARELQITLQRYLKQSNGSGR